MKKMSKLFLAAFGAVALLASPAKAITFTPAGFNGSVTTDFSEPTPVTNPSAIATGVGAGDVVEGATTSSIFYKSPWDTTSLWDTSVTPNEGPSYTAVKATSFGSATANSAAYSFSASNSVSLMWGSVDGNNSLEFLSGGSVVATLLGSDLLSGDMNVLNGNGFVNVSILLNVAFDGLKFSTGDAPFEFANLQVTAVPLPAGLPLYGAGLALLGFIGWRKRNKSA